tara:strand:+ start:3044 stop:3295 length:252 start_codon:yes stop_codon:yes gene_type:complete
MDEGYKNFGNQWQDSHLSEEERIEDTYARAFVLSMGVRCPTKSKLVERFIDFCTQERSDDMLKLTESEIYAKIPDFIEYLGEI